MEDLCVTIIQYPSSGEILTDTVVNNFHYMEKISPWCAFFKKRITELKFLAANSVMRTTFTYFDFCLCNHSLTMLDWC